MNNGSLVTSSPSLVETVPRAASISGSLLAFRNRSCGPVARAAACKSLTCGSDSGLRGLTRMATAVAPGRSSRTRASRLVVNSEVNRFTPVALPPGRLKLATRPNFTGSSAAMKTSGIVSVVALAARAEVKPVAIITATRCWARSAASAGKRSNLPSAQRYSISTFRPST